MKKENIIRQIAEKRFPNNVVKQSLEISGIERCGYTKSELLGLLEREYTACDFHRFNCLCNK